MTRKQYMINGRKVSKAKYKEQMRAIHSKDYSKKGYGKKRFRKAQQIDSQRPLQHRQIDYDQYNKETIDVSNDNIDEYSVQAFDSWKENQGSADIVGIDTPEWKRENQAIESNFDKQNQILENIKSKPKKKNGFGSSELAKEIANDNRKYYRDFLDQNSLQELPKGSKLGFLEIASLQRKIEKSSYDWKSDSIYDDLDLGLTYDENLEILERKYPQNEEKDLKQQELAFQRERNEEFLEDYYLEKAESNPTKAIEDTMHNDKPVRQIPSGDINKKWLKNPFNKSTGDYKGIDDNSKPFNSSDFTKDAFQKEAEKDYSKLSKKEKKNIALLLEAKAILDSSDSGYLYPAQKSLLRGAIKNKEYSYLKEQLPKTRAKLKKQKKEIQDRDKREANQKQELAKNLYKDIPKNQLVRKLVKLQLKQEDMNNRYSELKSKNPADRTQRKARLQNSLDGGAREIERLKDYLSGFQDKNKWKRYKEVENRLSVLNDRIQYIENGIPARSTYEQRQPFIKQAKPLLKERNILLLEQVNLEKPYLYVDKKGKTRFDYAKFVDENK